MTTKLSITKIRTLLFISFLLCIIAIVGIILVNVLEKSYFQHQASPIPWYEEEIAPNTGLKLVYPLRAFSIIIRFVLAPMTFIVLILITGLFFISFYDKHRLISLRYLKTLRFVMLLNLLTGFFHIIITGLFIDSQRISNVGAVFYDKKDKRATMSLIAFALGFATLLSAYTLFKTISIFRAFFKEDKNCVITTVNNCGCHCHKNKQNCSNNCQGGSADDCSNNVRKLVAPGKIDANGHLHVLLKTDDDGNYQTVQNCDPLYDLYHYDSDGKINSSFFGDVTGF